MRIKRIKIFTQKYWPSKVTSAKQLSEKLQTLVHPYPPPPYTQTLENKQKLSEPICDSSARRGVRKESARNGRQASDSATPAHPSGRAAAGLGLEHKRLRAWKALRWNMVFKWRQPGLRWGCSPAPANRADLVHRLLRRPTLTCCKPPEGLTRVLLWCFI